MSHRFEKRNVDFFHSHPIATQWVAVILELALFFDRFGDFVFWILEETLSIYWLPARVLSHRIMEQNLLGMMSRKLSAFDSCHLLSHRIWADSSDLFDPRPPHELSRVDVKNCETILLLDLENASRRTEAKLPIVASVSHAYCVLGSHKPVGVYLICLKNTSIPQRAW